MLVLAVVNNDLGREKKKLSCLKPQNRLFLLVCPQKQCCRERKVTLQ